MTAEDDVPVKACAAASDRRRRLLAMGGALAETTSDETDQGWGEGSAADARERATDARLRREVPPHHGG